MEAKCEKCGCIILEDAIVCTRCGAPRTSMLPSQVQLKDLNEEAYCAAQGIPYTPKDAPRAAKVERVNPREFQEPTRKLGVGLSIGIFLMPYVFSWFLLRKGYGRKSRILGFTWLGVVVLGAIARG